MKYLDRIIEYGLYLLVFLLPMQTRWIIKPGILNGGPWEYGTYSLYGTDILLIIVLFLFIIYNFLKRRITNYPLSASLRRTSGLRITDLIQSSKFKIQNYFIRGLVLAAAVSVFFAANRLLALYKFGWLILGAGLFWLIVSANYNRLKLVYALLAGAFFSASLGIWQFLYQAAPANQWLGLASHRAADLGASVISAIGADGRPERWLRAYGGLDHPNILGGTLAIAILFLVGQIVFQPKAFKIINWLLVLIFTAGIFFSFSRSAWLALGAGIAVTVIMASKRQNLKYQKGLAEIILVAGILLLLLSSQHANLLTARLSGQARLEHKSNYERLASYQAAWPIIKNNWLTGVGPGNYTLALSREQAGRSNYYYQPAHNVFFLALAEIGLAGLIFFIGVIFFVLVNRPRRPERGAPGHDMETAILIALVVLMFFDHWLFSLHFGALFFWLVLGLIARNSQPATSDQAL